MFKQIQVRGASSLYNAQHYHRCRKISLIWMQCNRGKHVPYAMTHRRWHLPDITLRIHHTMTSPDSVIIILLQLYANWQPQSLLLPNTLVCCAGECTTNHRISWCYQHKCLNHYIGLSVLLRFYNHSTTTSIADFYEISYSYYKPYGQMESSISEKYTYQELTRKTQRV